MNARYQVVVEFGSDGSSAEVSDAVDDAHADIKRLLETVLGKYGLSLTSRVVTRTQTKRPARGGREAGR